MSIPDDAARHELPEQLDRASDDAGGMPYDDDLGADDEAPRTRGAGPAYDSASSLIDRNIAFPDEAPAGMQELRSYVRSRWGGADLGILAKPPRAVRRRHAKPPQLGDGVGLAVAGPRSRSSRGR